VNRGRVSTFPAAGHAPFVSSGSYGKWFSWIVPLGGALKASTAQVPHGAEFTPGLKDALAGK
jgi:hypothetical protein